MRLVKNLEFDPAGFEDFAWWVENDRKKALKIIKLIKDIHGQKTAEERIGVFVQDISGIQSKCHFVV